MKKALEPAPRITLLAGGVGAARLARGLARLIAPTSLTVVVNTADDEEFYGLHVSPDVDTLMYTLAGLAPWSPGWGVRGDTFRARKALDRLYGNGYFALGDRDLATHIYRSQRLGEGAPLSRITRELCDSLGVTQLVLPMSDDPVRTLVRTERGTLAFQDYLVRRKARPRVIGFAYRGARAARAAPGVLAAIRKAARVVIAPSNPLTSIAPMLAIPELRAALRKARARTVAVSPLVAGRAVKGPLAAMLRGIGDSADNDAIADFYAGYAKTLLVSPGDLPRRRGKRDRPEAVEFDTFMRNPRDCVRVARATLREF